MSSFDNKLLQIHEQISIRDEDRRPYMIMFQDIKNWLMREMCDVDPLFKKMFKGTELFGSYPNRVRIIKPSEFDVFILFELPFPFKVSPHRLRPGFVKIASSKWKHLRNSEIRDKLEELFDERGMRRQQFQNWIEDIIDFIMENRPQPKGYSVKYSSCNVAHQIRVKESRKPHKFISIDFVPAIKLPKETVEQLVKGVCKGLNNYYLNTFVAIPKRLTGCGPKKSRSYTFQLVNPVAERVIIWDQQNLKVVYRLLKSLRDKLHLRRLKSYFLTAIFLLEVEEQPAQFWHHPIGEIFLHMLSQLIDYFAEEFLPFYWAPRFNILEILREEEITLYEKKLVDAYNRLRKLSLNMPVRYTVASHFQTRADD